MRTFYLRRYDEDLDESPIVAEGIEFTDGRCVMTWLTGINSIVIYNNMDELRNIHVRNHNSTTVIYYGSFVHSWNDSTQQAGIIT